MENENKKERRESRLSSKRGSDDCRASREEPQRNQAAGIMEYPCVDSYTLPSDCSPFSGKLEREAYYYGKTSSLSLSPVDKLKPMYMECSWSDF